MKTMLYIFLLSFIISSSAHSEESIFDGLDYYRVTTNYNGSAYNGKTILVYGEAGIIVRSEDIGMTWKQTNLDDYFNILSMTNIGNDFYGVIDKQYIIKSTDDGSTWQKFDFGDSTYFYKILANNDNLYCLSGKNVTVYDKTINKIREYHIVKDSTSNNDFTITGNNLVYSSGKGGLGLINLQNDSTTFINMESLGLCADCPSPSKLFSDGTITYFNIGVLLFQLDGGKVEKVFNSIKDGIFATNGADVFEVYNVIYRTEDISQQLSNLDSLYFVQINKSTQTSTDIKLSGSDRYITLLNITKLQFLTSNLIIAVGKDKLIYLSTDGGVNWNLKSHYNPEDDNGEITVNDKNHAFLNGKYLKFINTKDGGVTWLPQKNYKPRYVKKLAFYFIDGISYFPDNENGFLAYTTDLQNDTTVAYSNDGSETVKLKYNNRFAGKFMLHYQEFSVCESFDKTIFCYPAYSSQENKIFTYFYRFNDSLETESMSRIDSSNIAFMNTFENNELFAVSINYRNPYKIGKKTYWDIGFSLISSKDTGVSWQHEMNFDLPGLNIQDTKSYLDPLVSINGNIYISYKGWFDSSRTEFRIYKINVKTKAIELINSKEKSRLNQITGYDKKAFVFSQYTLNASEVAYDIEVNDDIDNTPTEWRKIGPTTRYSDLHLYPQKDSMLYIRAYDSLFKTKVIFFAKPKTTSAVVEVEPDQNKLYLSKPIPNPMQLQVKARLYWENNMNIENARFEVYDLLGTVVSQAKQFTLNKLNSYSGDLVWSHSGLPAGVYLIVVKLGDVVRTTPVVIEK